MRMRNLALLVAIAVLVVGCAGGDDSSRTSTIETTTSSSTVGSTSTSPTTASATPSRDFVVHDLEVHTYTGDQAILFAIPDTRLDLSLLGPVYSTTEMTLRDIASGDVVAEATPSVLPDISELSYVTTGNEGLLVEGSHPSDETQAMALYVHSGEGLYRVVIPADPTTIFYADIRPGLEIVITTPSEGILDLWLNGPGSFEATVSQLVGGTVFGREQVTTSAHGHEIAVPAGENLLTFDGGDETGIIHLYASFFPESGAYDEGATEAASEVSAGKLS